MTEQRIMGRRRGSKDRLLGAVLADDRSSPYGSDKAQALFGGTTWARHAAALLADIADEVLIVGRGGVPDMPKPGLGPLGGIAGALDYAAGHDFRCVLTIGCEMPRLPEGLLAALMRRGPSYCVDAPALGYWSAALGAHLMAHLEVGGNRSVRRWAESIGAIPIAARQPLADADTREDLMAL